MANDSSSGGYLSPLPTTPPLQGQALLNFLQAVIVGITGLDGTMVRPYWQGEPPNVPDAGLAWCAFRIQARPSDTFPFVKHNADGQGGDALQRHEALHILTSFYDLGSGGNADGYASLLRDGLLIAQNREILTLNKMGLAKTGDIIPVPSLLKFRWLYRADFDLVIRRQIDRLYPVLDVLSAQGTIVSDDGLSRVIAAPPVAPVPPPTGGPSLDFSSEDPNNAVFIPALIH